MVSGCKDPNIASMPDFTDIDREDFRNLLMEIGKTRIPFGKFRHPDPAAPDP